MNDKVYLKIGDISAYKISYDLGNKIWSVVLKWDYFARDTVGKQFARCVDSISANIAEGFGRFHKKDRVKFYYNARGSVFEAQDWLKKAKDRGLIGDEEFEEILGELRQLPKEINQLIKFTNDKLTIYRFEESPLADNSTISRRFAPSDSSSTNLMQFPAACCIMSSNEISCLWLYPH